MHIVAAMPKAVTDEEDAGVLFVRGMPRELLAKIKAAAALNHQTLAEYVRELFTAHVAELERKGGLPKAR